MRDDLNNRFREVGVGMLLLFLGFSFANGSEIFSLIFVLSGFYLLARQFDRTRRTDASDRAYREIERAAARTVRPAPPEHDGSPSAYRHALEAVRRAGHDPNTLKVRPVDIGVMVFSDAAEPEIHRTRAIPDDADYVQPFIQLEMPVQAEGRVRFEILDASGDLLFVHEDERALERGLNLLSPAARLPVHDDHDRVGMWTLRVSAEGVVLAEHTFMWAEARGQIRPSELRLSDDGEITQEMKAMLATSRLEAMSLDELLADQDDEPVDQRRARRR